MALNEEDIKGSRLPTPFEAYSKARTNGLTDSLKAGDGAFPTIVNDFKSTGRAASAAINAASA